MRAIHPIPLVTVALTLLSACAAAAAPVASSSATGPDRDCSFRSATTCWTLAPRIPARGPEARDSAPDRIMSPPRPVLAGVADTAVGLAERR
jgi:hypothetical protein